MADEIVLSHSSTAMYWKCHWQWYIRNILQLPERPKLAMALGKAVHAGIEAFHTKPIRPRTELWRVFDAEKVRKEDLDADPLAIRDGLVMLRTYMLEVSPTTVPTMIERPFTIRVENVLWTGIIDSADEKTDIVDDVKTTSGKTINGRKPSFSPDRYDMQLTGYGEGYRALTGRAAKKLRLIVLKRTGKWQVYEREPRLGEFLDLVRLTRDSIMGRSFEPTGLLNGACQSCQFTEVCEFYVRQ